MKIFDNLKFHGVRNRQKYLNNTDWLTVRLQDSSKPVGQTILDKRALARAELSLIRDATEYSEIEHLTQEF